MPYQHVFLVEDGDKVLGLFDNYDKACSAIHKHVAQGDSRDSYPFVQVWKNIVYYEDGRRPSKGWLGREFLMLERLYKKPER